MTPARAAQSAEHRARAHEVAGPVPAPAPNPTPDGVPAVHTTTSPALVADDFDGET